KIRPAVGGVNDLGYFFSGHFRPAARRFSPLRCAIAARRQQAGCRESSIRSDQIFESHPHDAASAVGEWPLGKRSFHLPCSRCRPGGGEPPAPYESAKLRPADTARVQYWPKAPPREARAIYYGRF